MPVDEQLRDQDWRVLSKQLTAYAFRRTGRRSPELAEELAQHAISDAFRFSGGWDPEKEPLLKHLCRRVRGLAANEMRRKRSQFEVAMSVALKRHGVSHDGGRKEIDAPSDDVPLDEALDAQRTAEKFRRRLGESLDDDRPALLVIGQILEGEEDASAQAAATGLTRSEVVAARRRVLRHAKKIAAELALELDAEENEVAS